MKAISKFLIIDKIKETTTLKSSGVMLSSKDVEDIRYGEAVVISTGDEVIGVKADDVVLFDKNSAYKANGLKDSYRIIHIQNIVAIL
jgi:co-chaperonin GroES (HSP10)